MIYICIPTHNEQQTVGVVLWKLRQVLTEYPRDYQLLVADDASTDKTSAVLEPYTRVLPLTVIRSEQQLGVAAATEMLLREAVRRSEYPKRDVIVTLQADFSEEPDDLVALIKRMEAGADVAIGNKVSITKPTRSHRWARRLADFFARGTKWPENVSTPFESYRAYRLYAIKNAIEDRKGKRLIRFAGWAGQADLLRAVMPHARRIDVIDVDDRLDRMQRPRRERAFAAAFEVRAMARGAEPAGLRSVEELDRLAATASRTRERGALIAEAAAAAAGNGRSAARNGGRSRDQRQGGRDRERARPQGERQRPRRGEGDQKSNQPGQPRTQRPAASGESQPRRGRNRTEGQEEQRRAKQAPVEAAAAEPAIVPAEIGEPKPKRKRRRRRKSGAGQNAAAAATEEGAETAGEAGPDEAGTEAPEAAAEGDTAVSGEKKRRRRGGRRGGRGRRRGPRPEGGEAPSEATSHEDGGGGSSPPPVMEEQ